MSYRRMLSAAACLLLLPACAVPLFPECGGWTREDRRCMNPETVSFIVPGETTKDDVIGRLGFPSRVLRNGAVYGYDWETDSFLLVLAGPNTGGGTGVARKNHVLLIEFDAGGTVMRREEKAGYFFPDAEFSAGASGAAEGPAGRQEKPR